MKCFSSYQLEIEQRKLEIRIYCWKSDGHRAYDCLSRGCKLCTKKHNTLLHICNENNHSVFKTESLPSHNKAENSSLHNKDNTTSKPNDSELVQIASLPQITYFYLLQQLLLT